MFTYKILVIKILCLMTFNIGIGQCSDNSIADDIEIVHGIGVQWKSSSRTLKLVSTNLERGFHAVADHIDTYDFKNLIAYFRVWDNSDIEALKQHPSIFFRNNDYLNHDIDLINVIEENISIDIEDQRRVYKFIQRYSTINDITFVLIILELY